MTSSNSSDQQLRSLIERIESLEEEKGWIEQDIREVYAEAKSQGFDPKVMRQVVRLRKKDRDERAVEQSLLKIYLRALEMES